MANVHALGPATLAIVSSVLLGTTCGNGANGPSPGGSTPTTGSWVAKAALPTARQEMPSALINGRIYTPGGYDAGGQTVAVLEVYDLAADRWASGPAMPEGRNHPGITAAGGQLFVIGGYAASGAATATVFAFNPSTQQWTTRKPMPD